MVEPDDIAFRSADAVSLDTLWRAFREGFQGYVVPVEIELEPFAAMLDSEHVDLSTSVVALTNEKGPAGICHSLSEETIPGSTGMHRRQPRRPRPLRPARVRGDPSSRVLRRPRGFAAASAHR
jgi:hypothetical protein